MEVQTPSEQLFFTTVRIETGTASQRGTGTAFVFTYERQGETFPFLVTNKHVVAGADVGRFFFVKREGERPILGRRVTVQLDEFASRWHGHPRPDIDVAVMPLGPVLHELENTRELVFFKSIPHSLIPTPVQLDELDAIEEVLFIGYPNGIFDTENSLPIARRGTTATPVQVDYNGAPVFLVDASVFPGSSGSPVLVCNSGGYAAKGGFIVGSRVIFLGVIAEVAFREEQSVIEFVSIPTSQVPLVTTREMIDLGVVYKASTVLETVEDLLRSRGMA